MGVQMLPNSTIPVHSVESESLGVFRVTWANAYDAEALGYYVIDAPFGTMYPYVSQNIEIIRMPNGEFVQYDQTLHSLRYIT